MVNLHLYEDWENRFNFKDLQTEKSFQNNRKQKVDTTYKNFNYINYLLSQIRWSKSTFNGELYPNSRENWKQNSAFTLKDIQINAKAPCFFVIEREK